MKESPFVINARSHESPLIVLHDVDEVDDIRKTPGRFFGLPGEAGENQPWTGMLGRGMLPEI